MERWNGLGTASACLVRNATAVVMAAALFGCSGNVAGPTGTDAAPAPVQPTEPTASAQAELASTQSAPAPAVAPAVPGPEAAAMEPMAPPYRGVPLSWTLDGSTSFLSLITTKQTDIAEVQTFERFGASVDQNGTATLAIDLASISTNVDLRDQRLRDILFEVASFPEATVTFTVDMSSVDGMEIGCSGELPVSATLSLHGASKTIDTSLWVSRLSPTEIVVQTKKPIVLNALDYNLGAGLDALIGLAGLDSISTAVPVEFMLTFESAGAAAGEPNQDVQVTAAQ